MVMPAAKEGGTVGDRLGKECGGRKGTWGGRRDDVCGTSVVEVAVRVKEHARPCGLVGARDAEARHRGEPWPNFLMWRFRCSNPACGCNQIIIITITPAALRHAIPGAGNYPAVQHRTVVFAEGRHLQIPPCLPSIPSRQQLTGVDRSGRVQ